MIRSSKHTLKFTNTNKLVKLRIFCENYRNMVQKYVNIIWHNQTTTSLLSSTTCNLITTNVEYDSRIRQCAAKQACSMVNAVLAKQNKRLHKLKQLQNEGKNTTYLQRKIDTTDFAKPDCSEINIELDSRFVNFEEGNHFDLFIEVEQIGDKQSFRLPINHTKVSNKWKQEGKIKQSIRLNENRLTLYFEVEKVKGSGVNVLGADQGQVTCLTLSDGQVTKSNKDGYDLNKIQGILSRRKKGSNGFRKAQAHRKNYINWSLNQLNFDNIKEVRLERILNIRKGKRSSRKLSHWTYTLIKNKLIGLSEDKGFVLTEQDNKFRSQRCSQCGFTHKSNRLAKTFRCKNTNCRMTTDSDLNAACNHEVDLCEVPNWVCKQQVNRSTGFYWLKDGVVVCQERIVPDVASSHILQ